MFDLNLLNYGPVSARSPDGADNNKTIYSRSPWHTRHDASVVSQILPTQWCHSAQGWPSYDSLRGDIAKTETGLSAYGDLGVQ